MDTDPAISRFSVRSEAPQVKGATALAEQDWDGEPNQCALKHLAAVEADLERLRRTFRGKGFGLDSATRKLILKNEAIILDILPESKQQRVETAIGEGDLEAIVVFDGRRTLVKQFSGFWRTIDGAPRLLEVLRG